MPPASERTGRSGTRRWRKRAATSRTRCCAWVARVLEVAGTGSDFGQSCTPNHYNNEGKPSDTSKQNGFFFGEPGEFMKILEDCRADSGMKDLEVRYGVSEA